jgi:hypothetical protein
MALEYRWPQNFQYGTLTSAISLSDTTINSAELAFLATLTSGNPHIPLTLINQATREYEIIWVSLHNAAATTATVVRGKEDTTAKAWPSGTQWICAPTRWDALMMWSTVTFPSDAHLGMRAAVNDRGEVYEKTFAQGWQGYFRMSGDDMGRTLDGTVADPPNGYCALHKSWTGTGTTNGSGILNLTIPNAGFPNKVVSAQVTRVTNNAAGTFWVPTVNRAATTNTVLSVLATNASGALASTAIEVSCDLTGY